MNILINAVMYLILGVIASTTIIGLIVIIMLFHELTKKGRK